MRAKTKAQYARLAMEAHSNLNIYHAIVAILEGGCLYGAREKTAQKIIALCKAEGFKELKIMDAALEKLK